MRLNKNITLKFKKNWTAGEFKKALIKLSFIILNIKLKNIISFYKILIKKDKVEKDMLSKKKFGIKPITKVKKTKGETE